MAVVAIDSLKKPGKTIHLDLNTLITCLSFVQFPGLHLSNLSQNISIFYPAGAAIQCALYGASNLYGKSPLFAQILPLP